MSIECVLCICMIEYVTAMLLLLLHGPKIQIHRHTKWNTWAHRRRDREQSKSAAAVDVAAISSAVAGEQHTTTTTTTTPKQKRKQYFNILVSVFAAQSLQPISTDINFLQKISFPFYQHSAIMPPSIGSAFLFSPSSSSFVSFHSSWSLSRIALNSYTQVTKCTRCCRYKWNISFHVHTRTRTHTFIKQ